jgi:hypothetical protein
MAQANDHFPQLSEIGFLIWVKGKGIRFHDVIDLLIF